MEELLQTRLVHDVDVRHFNDQEVEDGASRGHWTEFFTGRVDLVLHFSGNGQFVVDFLGRHLGIVEDNQQIFVVDQRAHSRSQPEEQVVFQLLDQSLVFHDRLKQTDAFGFQLGALGRDDAGEQLIFQSTLGDCKIDHGHFGADFWSVRRIGQFGGNVKCEAGHDVAIFVANDDFVHRSGADKVLVQKVVQDGIEFFADVFDQKRPAERQGVVQMGAEIFVVERRDLQFVVTFFGFDPVLPLALRVD